MSGTLSLRGYQAEANFAVRAEFSRGVMRTLMVLPTGTGKTICVVFLIHDASSRGWRSCVLVNSDELVQQTVEKLRSVGIDPGIVKQNKRDWTRSVTVASVQTLSRAERLAQIPRNAFGFIVVDEAHFANAKTYQSVLEHFVGAWVLGITATPFRGDRESLAKGKWESIAYVYPLGRAIREGWLVPPMAYRVETGLNIDQARTGQDGDFQRKTIAEIIDTRERNDLIAQAYVEQMPGAKAIAFGAGVRHAISLANAFRRRGIVSFAVHCKMPLQQRRAILAGHKAGQFPILSNYGVLTHGYDDVSLGAIILARPTKSRTLYVQMLGRGLRPYPGKTECKVLDVVDVSKRHSVVIMDEIRKLNEELEG